MIYTLFPIGGGNFPQPLAALLLYGYAIPWWDCEAFLTRFKEVRLHLLFYFLYQGFSAFSTEVSKSTTL